MGAAACRQGLRTSAAARDAVAAATAIAEV
jgi:hypothetical protein